MRRPDIRSSPESPSKQKRQKTNRIYRTVDLLKPLAEDLADWRATSSVLSADALIFPRPDGAAWRTDDWNNWRNRHFHPAAAHAGSVVRDRTTCATRSPRC